MKNKVIFIRLFVAVVLIFTGNLVFSQAQNDTVKTGTTNDPMVINPGQSSDDMSVKPEKTNDDVAAFTDTGFISKNIMDNMMEIRLAKLGQTKGRSLQVKKTAALMVAEHTAMLNDLKKLAAKKGISQKSYMHSMPLPANIAAGSNFDKTWASEMLTMHEAKIAELENYLTLSTDKDIKAAATRALPKIKQHRDALLKIPGAKSKTGVA